MRNQESETAFDSFSPQAKETITSSRELSDAELDRVSGGINPQPLPPQHDPD